MFDDIAQPQSTATVAIILQTVLQSPSMLATLLRFTNRVQTRLQPQYVLPETVHN